MKIIAEVKKTSPFSDWKVDDVQLEWRVKEYERLGASAISIVTAKAFQGEKQWVTEARKHTKLPILRKDFLSKPEEIEETKDLGADWVLLVSELLAAHELDALTFHAWRVGLKPVVEVNSLFGIGALPYCDTSHVLINNRNIRTGKLNTMTLFNLLPLIDDKYEITAASGLDEQPAIIKTIKKIGEIDNILVGTAFMRSTNLEETFKQHG